jgi:hypothetical protein
VAYKALGHGRYGADAVGANGGRVEDEGAWYKAEMEAHLLEEEGWRGRRQAYEPHTFFTTGFPRFL